MLQGASPERRGVDVNLTRGLRQGPFKILHLYQPVHRARSSGVR
jgi:hypothetical protein